MSKCLYYRRWQLTFLAEWLYNYSKITTCDVEKKHVPYLSFVYSELCETEFMDVCLMSILTKRQLSSKTELKLYVMFTKFFYIFYRKNSHCVLIVFKQ